jgi:D-xylose reductase
VQFEDGSVVPEEFFSALAAFQDETRCVYPWTAGQFCIVDNSVAAHSRQPFSGRRVTYAAIAQGVEQTPPPRPRPLSLTLSSGDLMPLVGLGLWKIPTSETAAVVADALAAGYRLLDSACDYGNEVEAGQGIARAIAAGSVTRDQLFVTSKLWNTYHRKEHVRAACERTLKDLGLDYLDLYLVHFPIALQFVPFEERYPPGWKRHADGAVSQPDMLEDKVPFAETWAAMEQLVRDGLVRNIGVCNMSSMMLRDVVNYASIKPAVLQVEMHPYNTQERLLRFCRSQGIAVTAFSNLGAGSYVSLGMATVDESCLNEDAVKTVAAKHKKTEAQIVLRWAVQRGTAIVPKTTSSARLRENLSVTDFHLSSEEMSAIAALDKKRRFNDPGHFCEAAFETFFPIYD